MNILIVDDHSLHRDLLAAILARWPEYSVRTVASGREAVILLKSHGHRLHVVFLDVEMPEVSGLNVLEYIQQSPLHRSLQVVMCTAHNDRATVTRAIELGARHYLVKPCTEEAVAQKLRQVVDTPGAPSA